MITDNHLRWYDILRVYSSKDWIFTISKLFRWHICVVNVDTYPLNGRSLLNWSWNTHYHIWCHRPRRISHTVTEYACNRYSANCAYYTCLSSWYSIAFRAHYSTTYTLRNHHTFKFVRTVYHIQHLQWTPLQRQGYWCPDLIQESLFLYARLLVLALVLCYWLSDGHM